MLWISTFAVTFPWDGNEIRSRSASAFKGACSYHNAPASSSPLLRALSSDCFIRLLSGVNESTGTPTPFRPKPVLSNNTLPACYDSDATMKRAWVAHRNGETRRSRSHRSITHLMGITCTRKETRRKETPGGGKGFSIFHFPFPFHIGPWACDEDPI